MKLPPLLIALASTVLFAQDVQDEEGPRAPRIGEKAPAFRLNDHTGKATQVGGESESWTVVAFYPKAMTPG